MGYHVIDPDGIDPAEGRPSEMRNIAEAVGLDNLGLRLYRVAPGEDMPLYRHYHEQQEEVFYVVEGTLSVETPDRTYTVPTGSFFIAEPGNEHRSFCDASAPAPAVVVAMGAPAVDDTVVLED